MAGTYRADAHGGAGVDKVAHAQGDEPRHVGDYLVDGEDHVGCVAALFHLARERHLETQVLYVTPKIGEGYELRRQRRRPVESLASLPRQPPGYGLALEISRSEVYSEAHLVVIPVGELLGYRAADAFDAHYQLAFVVDLRREVGNEERVVVAQQRRVGFHEEDRRGVGPTPLAVQLGYVGAVVSRYADYFHFSRKANR